MPVKVVIGDALQTDSKYICHQVNYYGVMGAGIAKQIKANYPITFAQYKSVCDESANKQDLLGTVLMVAESGKTIINMFSQDGMGHNGCFTDYEAFKKCLQSIASQIPFGEAIAMPYLIGCGIAGGGWEIVLNLIKDALGLTHEVLLYDVNRVSLSKNKE